MKCNGCRSTMVLERSESSQSSISKWHRCPLCQKVRLTCSKTTEETPDTPAFAERDPSADFRNLLALAVPSASVGTLLQQFRTDYDTNPYHRPHHHSDHHDSSASNQTATAQELLPETAYPTW